MKRKLTAFLCAAAMLMTLLAGCGSAAPETTPETQAAETQPPETTAATLAATEPTEPKTFFEEQGLTLWGDTETEGLEKVFDSKGVLTTSNSEGSSVYGTEGIFEKFNMDFISYTNSEKKKMVSKNIVNSYLHVLVWEYFSKDFNAMTLKDTIDAFYQLYSQCGMSKTEWLAAHENYKIMHCEIEQYIYTSDQVDADSQKGAHYYSLWGEELAIMDMNTGEVFVPSIDYPQWVNEFTVKSGDSEYVLTAVFDFSGEALGNADNGIGDMELTMDLYVLAPTDCADLAFVYPETKELGADEEYIDVEKPAWEVYKYTDYINKLNRFQMHYFTVMN